MKKYFQALLSQTYIQHHHQCQHQYLHQGMFVKAAEDDIETNLHILPFFSVYNLPFIINNFLHLSYLVSLQFANYPEHFWEPSS